MKTINYEKTKGFFTIQYIDDDEIFEGTININGSSIKTDLKKYIIDNEIGDIFSYKTKVGSIENTENIKIIDKKIDLIFDDVNEETYFKYNSYNSDSEFKNIKYENHLDPSNIYFQFYYKSIEYKKIGTISNKIINGLKKYPVADYYSADGYIEDFEFFKRIFIYNFLKKYNLLNYNMLCCVPSHEATPVNNNPISMMIKEISDSTPYIDASQLLIRTVSIPEQKTQGKRFEETHLNSVKVNGNVQGKNIILIDDITTSGSSLKACKKLLLDAGANSVLCFAFSKSN